MFATLLLELGLPDAPHRDCMRFRSVVPQAIREVFERHGIDYEGVRPMGSLRRLAFLVEGIPTFTNPVSGWVSGPVERVGRASDGTLTPVTVQFLQRCNKQSDDLDVREIEGVRRLGVQVDRKAVLAATVLPVAMAELMDVIAMTARARLGKTVELGDVLQWIVALLGDARVRFRWHNLESDRYTYTSTGQRVLVPHFYEYHAVLAQAGIRVDEATRREHIRRELNAVAADFGGRCVLANEQLEHLSSRLDEPTVHLHRGLPLELGARFIQALAFAATYCVAVRRDDGSLAPGWLIVTEKASEPSEDDSQSESELAHRAFARVVDEAATWLKSRVDGKARRESIKRTLSFVEFVSRAAGASNAQLNSIGEAAWYCLEAEATAAFEVFPGAHLLLALQRATSKRAGSRVLELIDSLVGFTSAQTGEKASGSLDGDSLILFLVMAFHDLVRGFESHQVPLAERDPLALRKRTEQLLELLAAQHWPFPMQEAVHQAVGAWGDQATSSLTATALLGFLRHRAARYLDKVRPPEGESVSLGGASGEWSMVGLLAPPSPRFS